MADLVDKFRGPTIFSCLDTGTARTLELRAGQQTHTHKNRRTFVARRRTESQTYVVDDVGLRLVGSRSFAVVRADDVHLVILEWVVLVAIHIDNVVAIVRPKAKLANKRKRKSN